MYPHMHNGKSERREKIAEGIYEEIMAQTYPNLLKNINLHIQEAQQTPSGINAGRFTPRHITLKMSKKKKTDRNLKASREK